MQQSIRFIKEKLSGIYEQGEVDAFCFIILNHLTGLTKSEMIVNSDIVLKEPDKEKVKEITQRLSLHEPIQYILGETEFYGLSFRVEPGVLIPRFETEELVNLIINENRKKEGIRILDMGTGSGCIAVSLKKNLPEADVWCCDISDKALSVAAENARLNQTQIHVEKYDLLGAEPFCEKGFSVLVSNPPYVTRKERELMPRNVLDHEPELALFVPNDDPLLYYREIVNKSSDLLSPGGIIYFEINEAFGPEVSDLLTGNGFMAEVIVDINGKNRMVVGRK